MSRPRSLALAQATHAFGDLTHSSAAREAAQQSLAEAEAAAHAQRSGACRSTREARSLARPLADADRRVQRLETEARTISKIVNGETQEPLAADHRRRARRQGL